MLYEDGLYTRLLYKVRDAGIAISLFGGIEVCDDQYVTMSAGVLQCTNRIPTPPESFTLGINQLIEGV